MKTLLLALCFSLMAVPTATPSQKAKCHTGCYQCRVRCKRSVDPKVCIEMCQELKRSCCANCGAGPGPRTTCSCT